MPTMYLDRVSGQLYGQATMNVSVTSGSGYVWSTSRSSVTASPSGSSAAATIDRAAATARRAKLGKLLEQLDTLEKNLKIPARRSAVGSSGLPTVMSDPIGLAAATPTRLTSTGPIGASGTSVTPRQPSWQKPTAAQLSVTGTYDGSDGEGPITFVAEGMPLMPNYSTVSVRAEAPDGRVIGVFDFAKSDPAGTSHSLGNGLSFSLDVNAIGTYPTAGNTAQVDVATGGANVDNPFDGIGSAGPDFDGAAAVTAGVFTLDGTVIDVLADDSVNGVLAKINASAAGVTVSFDASSERVEIVRDTPGALPDIELSSDSSGFLDAVKLASASIVPGRDADWDRPLVEIVLPGGVSSGTITVSGEAIAIDVNTDSLQDVIDAITAAGVGVTASLESSGGQFAVKLTASTPQFTLDGGGTGFFAALGITESTYGSASAGSSGSGSIYVEAQASTSRALRARSYRAADALEDVHDTFGKLFSSDVSGTLGPLRDAIVGLLTDAVDEHGKRRLERLGLDFLDGDDSLLRTGRLSRRRFVVAVQSERGLLEKVLLGTRGSGNEGLIEDLRELIGDYLGRGNRDVRGLLVDRFA